jgi:hypothetical protein
MSKVVVGESTKKPSRPFFVHAGLLTSRSTFFATALKNYGKADHGEPEGDTEQIVEDRSIQWREGKEGFVKLPVDEPGVFANYVQLLYTGVLLVFEDPGILDTDVSTVTDGEKKKAATVVHTRLTKLYIFCNKIGMLQQNRRC